MDKPEKVYCYYCVDQFNANHACRMRYVKQYLHDLKEAAVSYCIARCTGSKESEWEALKRLSMLSNAEGQVKEL